MYQLTAFNVYTSSSKQCDLKICLEGSGFVLLLFISVDTSNDKMFEAFPMFLHSGEIARKHVGCVSVSQPLCMGSKTMLTTRELGIPPKIHRQV